MQIHTYINTYIYKYIHIQIHTRSWAPRRQHFAGAAPAALTGLVGLRQPAGARRIQRNAARDGGRRGGRAEDGAPGGEEGRRKVAAVPAGRLREHLCRDEGGTQAEERGVELAGGGAGVPHGV